MNSKLVALFVIAFLVLACTGPSTDAVQAKVDKFHNLYNAGNYDQMYNEASPALRESADLTFFHKYMGSVHEKLGRFNAQTNVQWQTYSGCGGSFVTLILDSQFENGAGKETFRYSLVDGEYLLNFYNIESNVFILGPDAVDI